MIRVLIAALFASGFATPAAAQTADVARIGAINLSYVARSSKAGQSALAEIEKFVKQKEAEAAARASELEKQRLEIQQRGSGLTERARGDLQKGFDRSRLEFERFQQDAQSEIQSFQRKFDAELRIRMTPIIDAISKEQGFHFVFGLEQAAIVWWSPAVDISAEVVKRLDAGK